MSKKIINNGDSGLVARTSMNDNFTELYDGAGNLIQTATDTPFIPTGGISGINVQTAIEEVNSKTGTLTASAVTLVPTGSISSTDVQSAITELDVDIQASGNLQSDGSVEMDAPYLPQNDRDVATVKFVKDYTASSTTTYIRNTLVEMLAIDPIVVGDICYVVADDIDPATNNGEYISITDKTGGSVIGDWSKRDESVAWGAIVGTLSDQPDLQAALDLKADKTQTDPMQVKTDFITVTAPVNLDTFVSNVTTNLTATYNSTSVVVTSSDGTDATITAVDAVDAGVMTVAQLVELQTATTDITALQSPDSIAFNDVTGSEPAYVAGQAYYANGTFNIHGEYDGVTLQLGQEQYIQVSNISGATIENGKPVYVTGVSGGLPAVDLAQADTFEKSRVIGITTMIIPDGGTGLVTTIGSISDIDTNGLGVGNILYLSDTVAGGYAEIAPDIATSLGSVLVADLTIGKMFVKVNNHIVLPVLFGEMEGGSTGGNITNIYQPIDNYDPTDSNLAMPTNVTNGTIHVPTTGKYRMTANISINYDNIGNNKPALSIGIYDGTAIIGEITVTVTKDSEGFALFPSKLFDAVAGTDLSLQIKSSTNLVNPVFDLMSFEIESTHIR